MDLRNLSLADLEKLIRDAGQERASRNQAFPNDPVGSVFPSTNDPRYEVRRVQNGVGLFMRNAHFGWVFYGLPLKEAQHLSRLLDQSARAGEDAAIATLDIRLAPRTPGNEVGGE